MISEVLLETLRFLDRESLDAVQLVTSGMRSTVDRLATEVHFRRLCGKYAVNQIFLCTNRKKSAVGPSRWKKNSRTRIQRWGGAGQGDRLQIFLA